MALVIWRFRRDFVLSGFVISRISCVSFEGVWVKFEMSKRGNENSIISIDALRENIVWQWYEIRKNWPLCIRASKKLRADRLLKYASPFSDFSPFFESTHRHSSRRCYSTCLDTDLLENYRPVDIQNWHMKYTNRVETRRNLVRWWSFVANCSTTHL